MTEISPARESRKVNSSSLGSGNPENAEGNQKEKYKSEEAKKKEKRRAAKDSKRGDKQLEDLTRLITSM